MPAPPRAALLLLALAASAAGTLARDFDYFMFTNTWAGTFCEAEFHRHCRHVVGLNNLTIHGLWPNYEDGGYPQFCDKSRPFDPDKVADLQSRLDAEWPDLLHGGLWSHEWDKHGTCALSVLPSEHEYFKAALDLNELVDLTGALARAGIVPSKTQRYAATDVVKAVQSVVGDDVTPELNCADGDLQEIRVCFTKTFAARNCGSEASSVARRRALRGSASNGHCSSTLRLPPFAS